MRKKVKTISLILTIIIFIVLDMLMFLIDFTKEVHPYVAITISMLIIAATFATGIYLLLKSRNKSQIKL